MKKAIFVLLIVSICFPESPKNNTFTRYNSLKTTIDSICSNILNSHDCARAIERHQIPLFKEDVIRKNSLLIFRLSAGLNDTLKDSVGPNDEGGVGYTFMFHYKDIGYYLFFVQYIDNSEYLFVNDQSGRKASCNGIPIFSNDVGFFCCSDGEYEFNIWKMSSDSITKVFCKFFDTPGNLSQTWVNQTTLRVARRIGNGIDTAYIVHYDKKQNKWK